MPSSTQENWQALQRIALRYFKDLRRTRGDCTATDVIAEMNLPETALILELLAKAGLREKERPTPDEVCAVAGMCIRGIWSESTISKESKIPIETVSAIFESFALGHGQAPYGLAPYGGNRRVSKNNQPVPRRITIVGQLNYRGKTYTLGAAYGGRNAMVREQDEQLLVTFIDKSPLYLTRRH